MLRIFIGYDHRQPVSYSVAHQSIVTSASKPVAITPLVLPQLPIERQGLTPFTFSRFLVPYLCDYEGWALFMDADMILNADVAELFSFADEQYAVLVAKEKVEFEWAAVMLMNCGHEANKVLTPEFIESENDLHRIRWLDDALIGSFPGEWNHLVGYDEPEPNPKLIHYTQGVPAFPETNTCEHADKWNKILQTTHSAIPWADLMGRSVHAINVNGRMVPKFLIDEASQSPAPGQEQKIRELLASAESKN